MNLSPTQWLILQILSTKEENGVDTWTFPMEFDSDVAQLIYADFVSLKSMNVSKGLVLSLTDEGRSATNLVPEEPSSATPVETYTEFRASFLGRPIEISSYRTRTVDGSPGKAGDKVESAFGVVKKALFEDNAAALFYLEGDEGQQFRWRVDTHKGLRIEYRLQ